MPERKKIIVGSGNAAADVARKAGASKATCSRIGIAAI